MTRFLPSRCSRRSSSTAELRSRRPCIRTRSRKGGRRGRRRLWLYHDLRGRLDAMRGIHKERTGRAAGQGGGELRGDPRRGHHVHILHRIIAERKDKARNVGRLRAILNDIGDSLVVVEDDDIVKVHVHTDQPNKALEEGLKFGPAPHGKDREYARAAHREGHRGHGGHAEGARDRAGREKVRLCCPSRQARASRACLPISVQMPSFRAARP